MADADDLYRPTEEHEAFRAAVREVCAAKVAPRAAETDELAEFPKACYEALVAADFHAPHVPEAYGGVAHAREPSWRAPGTSCQSAV